jgi:outer membrane immunogenic protein
MQRSTFLAAATLSCAFIQVASAADLAVKAEPPPQTALTWTGFYMGVHGGAAWQSTPQFTFFDPNAPGDGIFPLQNLSGASKPGLGGVGGLQGGYNWQFAPAWVVGLEGDFSWASLADNRTTPALTPTGLAFGSIAMSANTEWLASVRGKFGFVSWSTLWYATGGGAWINTEYTGNINNTALTHQDNVSFNQTKSGWVFGGGAEWQATNNILLRAEYLYYGFSTGTIGSAFTSPPITGEPAPFQYTWNKYNVQVARIAASYKF